MRSLTPYSPSRDTSLAFRNDPFSLLRREMGRIFDTFDDWNNGGTETALMPRIDVRETDKDVDIDAELPGMQEKDIEVMLSGDTLTIRGEKKAEREEKDKNLRISERSYGSFQRQIALPFDADPNMVAARFANGVLHVTIPKPANASSKSTRIPIKGN